MPTLTITRGLPGSGKSTWARRQPGVRVNRDELRAMLRPGRWPHGDRAAERMCTVAQHAQIEALLRAGHDVVCDDTNLRARAFAELCALAERVGASIREVNFLIVPIEECIARDAARPEGERVGEATIRAMWQRYLDDLATV
jgi:predicted kinase